MYLHLHSLMLNVLFVWISIETLTSTKIMLFFKIFYTDIKVLVHKHKIVPVNTRITGNDLYHG